MIHDLIRQQLIAWPAVTALIGSNPKISDPDDAYSIRPGMLNESDPFPGIVIALPDAEGENDFDSRAPLIRGELHVRSIARSLTAAWALRDAVCYAGGDPQDAARSVGLIGLAASDARYRVDCVLYRRDQEILIDIGDGSDLPIWAIQTEFDVHFQELS